MIFYSYGKTRGTSLLLQRLVSVVVSKILVFPLSPIENSNAKAQSRTGLHDEPLDSLDNVARHVLEKRRNNVLLERRQVLSNLAIHLVVLLPQLNKVIQETVEFKEEVSKS